MRTGTEKLFPIAILGIVALWLIATNPFAGDETTNGQDDVGWIQEPTMNGNANVGMVVLTYNTETDQTLVPRLKSHTETQTEYHYSVQSFFQEYGMYLHFNFYAYNVVQLADMIELYGDPCDINEEYSYCRADAIIYGWARDNPDAVHAVYNQNQVLTFVVHTDIPTFTSAGTYVTIDAYEGSNSAMMQREGAAAFIIAHEVGHLFGGLDLYWNPPSGCENSLMNEGGGGSGYLTKQTDFCNEDMDELHFDWVKKVSDNYLNGG